MSPLLFQAPRPGDHLTFNDNRGRRGRFEVVAAEGSEAHALCPASVYVETGLAVAVERSGAGDAADRAVGAPPAGTVGTLPSQDDPVVLRSGDTLILHRDLHPGETIVLDDGKARGFVREVRDGELDVEITAAPREGMKLRGSKGINLPDSRLCIPSLTEQDRQDLRFIAAHADGVDVSFVNHPDDVEDLLDELDAVGDKHLGLILKIETRQGFRNLPGILLAAMEWPRVGVMIARGDLAVEAGWVDLARLQEEILSVCEAAHVPVVWATEVLDKLAKKGTPTRSEISDVVMAERAECVMLNKGPYIVDAIHTLEDVLRSVQAWQRKKTTLLPPLPGEAPDPTEVGRAVGTRQGRRKGA